LDANDAEEKEELSEDTGCTFADSASERWLQSWDLKDIHRGDYIAA
jgi:hypothetical protein